MCLPPHLRRGSRTGLCDNPALLAHLQQYFDEEYDVLYPRYTGGFKVRYVEALKNFGNLFANQAAFQGFLQLWFKRQSTLVRTKLVPLVSEGGSSMHMQHILFGHSHLSLRCCNVTQCRFNVAVLSP